MLYPVAIFKKDNQFVAQVPDLPALHVTGLNMVDIIRTARADIIAHLQYLTDRGDPIPKGQDIGVYLDDARFFGVTWAMISLDSVIFAQTILPYEVILPKPLLHAIYEKLGATDDESVQAFIVDAIKDKLM